MQKKSWIYYEYQDKNKNKQQKQTTTDILIVMYYYFSGGLILIGSVGMFSGGLFIRLFHMQVKGMLMMCFVSGFLSAVIGISFIAGCPEVPLAGLEVPYHNTSE
jgi:hypothetical protein